MPQAPAARLPPSRACPALPRAAAAGAPSSSGRVVSRSTVVLSNATAWRGGQFAGERAAAVGCGSHPTRLHAGTHECQRRTSPSPHQPKPINVRARPSSHRSGARRRQALAWSADTPLTL